MNQSLTSAFLNILPNLAKNSSPDILAAFKNKINSGHFTRAQDPVSHINTMAAFYDPKLAEIFWGFHLKAQCYCFNGGHTDETDSSPAAVIQREISEELGLDYALANIHAPELITCMDIYNPQFPCREHFDVFFFFPVNKNHFHFDAQKMATEYSHWGWYPLAQAKKMNSSTNNFQALELIEKKLISR
ncbi:MAG: NUDIX domain-containing protein [bacterium]|nr:NUDIX domain-containing protein [bacterium]